MTKHSYRIAYEGLKTCLAEAAAMRDAEAEARAAAELDAFVATMVADPRKLRAIALDSPACAAELRAHAAELDLPRAVLDPVHDASFARLWLATLDDRQIGMLQRVLADEVGRRGPVPEAHGAFRLQRAAGLRA